ncbi:MAG TPA: hypothetical protein VFF03_00725 [Rhodocyclaceae bacterium]|nr:hypothetical protein [Rhodocyclaceae bacterium]
MSDQKRGIMAEIFIAMMMFCGLVWVWTVAFILGWPWEASTTWKPEFRLAAVCANNEACGVTYGELADAKAKGTLVSLAPAEATGEVEHKDAWLRWKKAEGKPWQIEAKSSSWYFQTTVRYRLEGDTPVLVEYQDVTGKALYYGMAAAFVSLIGIVLRRLRRR